MSQQICLFKAFKLIDNEPSVIDLLAQNFCFTSIKITGNLPESDDPKFITNF